MMRVETRLRTAEPLEGDVIISTTRYPQIIRIRIGNMADTTVFASELLRAVHNAMNVEP